mmetsp:Transcript_11994/g.21881  ORF Transcript_11994/g.21881 Transcript_11994/m.21881 type:complete len:210 (+) Transcript_11994:1136-1765(+)
MLPERLLLLQLLHLLVVLLVPVVGSEVDPVNVLWLLLLLLFRTPKLVIVLIAFRRRCVCRCCCCCCCCCCIQHLFLCCFCSLFVGRLYFCLVFFLVCLGSNRHDRRYERCLFRGTMLRFGSGQSLFASGLSCSFRVGLGFCLRIRLALVLYEGVESVGAWESVHGRLLVVSVVGLVWRFCCSRRVSRRVGREFDLLRRHQRANALLAVD